MFRQRHQWADRFSDEPEVALAPADLTATIEPWVLQRLARREPIPRLE